MQAPRLHVILEFVFEPLEAFAVFGNGSDLCLKDDVLRWCGADHFREPPEMGRAPSGPAGVAEIVSEHKGFEAQLGELHGVPAVGFDTVTGLLGNE